MYIVENKFYKPQTDAIIVAVAHKTLVGMGLVARVLLQQPRPYHLHEEVLRETERVKLLKHITIIKHIKLLNTLKYINTVKYISTVQYLVRDRSYCRTLCIR